MKITNIKQQVKRPDRYSIYIDGAFAFGLSEGALVAARLASGQEIDTAQLAALKETAVEDKAFGNALRYVAMRPRSEWELTSYLHRKKVDEPIIEQIVQRLRSLDFVDDRTFAESWVANRRLLKATSKRRLAQELQQKRVATNIIDEVLREDETSEAEVIAQLIAKKRQRYPDRQKLMHYLVRQGFSYDMVRSGMEAVDLEDQVADLT